MVRIKFITYDIFTVITDYKRVRGTELNVMDLLFDVMILILIFFEN